MLLQDGYFLGSYQSVFFLGLLSPGCFGAKSQPRIWQQFFGSGIWLITSLPLGAKVRHHFSPLLTHLG